MLSEIETDYNTKKLFYPHFLNPFPAVDKYICLPKFVSGARLFLCIVVYCCHLNIFLFYFEYAPRQQQIYLSKPFTLLCACAKE